MSLIPVIDYTAANIGDLAAKARALRAKLYAPAPRPETPISPVARFSAPAPLKQAVAWTPAEIDMLKQMARRGSPRDVIAGALSRPPVRVVRKAKSLGLELKRAVGTKAVKQRATFALRRLIHTYRQDMPLYAEVAVVPMRPTAQTVIRAIIQEVAARAGVTREDILSGSRTKHIVRARQMAVWLAARETHLSLPHIGRIFGDRDHTTILYTIRRENERRGANVRGAGFITEARKEATRRSARNSLL